MSDVSAGEAIKVVVVDDDDLMRAGLRSVLSTDDSIEVVGEARDGRDAVARVPRLEPDVVLMDVRMPDLDGIAATAELLAGACTARILIVTTFEHDEYVFGALKAGASGFLLKRTSPEDLLAAVHTVAEGEALLSPSITRRVVDRMARQPLITAGPELDELTAREREVLGLIAQGLSNREIAAELVVEETTVKSHVKRVLMKLGLRDRVQAVIHAYESGLIAPGERGET